MAGLTVERLINEPTAAALAYGLHQRDTESQFLVFDLGGGTFDVSVLELLEGIMEVRASTGDNFLGGEDFVDCLVDGFMASVGAAAGLDHKSLDAALRQALREQAERAKLSLTGREDAEMRLRWKGDDLTWTVEEARFDDLSKDLLTRLSAPVERALRDARIRPAELDEVLLIGGATRMPIVRRLVARMFGRVPSSHFNPDEAVALGAAVQAGLKARDAALDEVVITDVCPYTLGIESARQMGQEDFQEGWFLPIIERNTTIPASRSERIYPLHDNQKEMDVRVFQGESRSVRDNIRLGKLALTMPRGKVRESAVDVRFTYDIDGLLEVETTVVATGATKSLVIEQNPGGLSPKDIAKRMKALAALKIHPRDQTANRAALARAERLYEERLGSARDWIGDLIARYEATLARQDPEEIDAQRSAFLAALDEIEGDPLLF